jgi:SnoaL-like domain
VAGEQRVHEDDYTSSALAQRLDALELRVRELEDERALRDLLTRYSFGADVFRGPQWVGLFTDDGSYDLGSQNVDGGYSGRFTGPDDLLALITGPGMPPAGRAQHFGGPMRFDISGDAATAEAYSITYQLTEHDRCEVYCLGFSRWEFRRENGRWRIAARHRRELGTGGEAEVVGPIYRV